MTIAFAAVHRTMAYDAPATGLRVVTFDDCDLFFSDRQPLCTMP